MANSWNGIPRNEIPWFPTVRVKDCTSCRTCFDFCSHGVYEWNVEQQKPVVKNPFNCIVGCSGCASQCPSGAIDFPPLSLLVELKHKQSS